MPDTIEARAGALNALADAARSARAASHSKRLDTATQGALQALVAFAAATVEHARAMEREIEGLKARARTFHMIGDGDE